MTTKEIFDKAIIKNLEQGLNDHVKNIQWPTVDEALRKNLQNQIVKAIGIPKEFLFGDD